MCLMPGTMPRRGLPESSPQQLQIAPLGKRLLQVPSRRVLPILKTQPQSNVYDTNNIRGAVGDDGGAGIALFGRNCHDNCKGWLARFQQQRCVEWDGTDERPFG